MTKQSEKEWLAATEWVNEPEPDWAEMEEADEHRWTPELSEDDVTATAMLATGIDWAPLDDAIRVANEWIAEMDLDPLVPRGPVNRAALAAAVESGLDLPTGMLDPYARYRARTPALPVRFGARIRSYLQTLLDTPAARPIIPPCTPGCPICALGGTPRPEGPTP